MFLFTRWPTRRHLLCLDLLMFPHVAGRIHIADLSTAPCKISFITVCLFSLDLILWLRLMPVCFSSFATFSATVLCVYAGFMTHTERQNIL